MGSRARVVRPVQRTRVAIRRWLRGAVGVGWPGCRTYPGFRAAPPPTHLGLPLRGRGTNRSLVLLKSCRLTGPAAGYLIALAPAMANGANPRLGEPFRGQGGSTEHRAEAISSSGSALAAVEKNGCRAKPSRPLSRLTVGQVDRQPVFLSLFITFGVFDSTLSGGIFGNSVTTSQESLE